MVRGQVGTKAHAAPREVTTSPATRVPVRVLLADPEAVVREGLRVVLRRTRDLRLEASAHTGFEAVRLAQLVKPDVAVVEVGFRSSPSGVRLVEELVRCVPGLGVLAFSDSSTESLVPRLLAAGARGYVPKDAGPDVLVHAIRAVASGGWFVQSGPGSPLFEGLRWLGISGPLDGARPPHLGARDREYLRLLVRGLTDAEIARTLHLAKPTVKAQMRKLYRTLGARNRAQAVARAVVLGLLA